jgi:hypothetical protein
MKANSNWQIAIGISKWQTDKEMMCQARQKLSRQAKMFHGLTAEC